jgi:hypothetical protein
MKEFYKIGPSKVVENRSHDDEDADDDPGTSKMSVNKSVSVKKSRNSCPEKSKTEETKEIQTGSSEEAVTAADVDIETSEGRGKSTPQTSKNVDKNIPSRTELNDDTRCQCYETFFCVIRGQEK